MMNEPEWPQDVFYCVFGVFVRNCGTAAIMIAGAHMECAYSNILLTKHHFVLL